MPKVNLNVSLNNGHLEVDQAGNGTQIGRGEVATISWHLTTAKGAFNELDASNRGFAWITTPPPEGVFTDLKLLPSGKIQVTDNNTDPGGVSSAGTWIYQLWATINKIEYSTIATLPPATSTNPTIKNL